MRFVLILIVLGLCNAVDYEIGDETAYVNAFPSMEARAYDVPLPAEISNAYVVNSSASVRIRLLFHEKHRARTQVRKCRDDIESGYCDTG